MMTESKIQAFKDLVKDASREELHWFHGYCSALLNQNNDDTSPNISEIVKLKPTILYGTETGNSKKIANELLAEFKKKKINAKVFDISLYPVDKLSKEELILLIISTQGEGELPITAQKFYDYFSQNKVDLSKTKFAVLALGDSSYPLFCQAGIDFDQLFENLNAERILPLHKCDVDYQEAKNNWFKEIEKTSLSNQSQENIKEKIQVGINGHALKTKNNYIGKVIEHINLNDNNSNKETYHIVIETDDELHYEPGDIAGFYPKNNPEIVQKIINLTQINPNLELTLFDKTLSVEDHLSEHLNINYLTLSIIKKYGQVINRELPEIRMDLLDLLTQYPPQSEAQFEEVLKILNPTSPRLYSIASSPTAHENELHLTVARSPFTSTTNQEKYGVCSDYLGGFELGEDVEFFIRKNPHFRLPNEDKDIIMIGPGTGIAPFRSFVSERDAVGAEGKNWLFFGDRKFTENFLYQTEWQQYVTTGILNKINLAWSRDEEEKNYVQNELQKESTELLEWLENGAYLYICGAKNPMSKDVEKTLINLLMTEKKLSEDEAKNYLETLEQEGRYQKDVY